MSAPPRRHHSSRGWAWFPLCAAGQLINPPPSEKGVPHRPRDQPQVDPAGHRPPTPLVGILIVTGLVWGWLFFGSESIFQQRAYGAARARGGAVCLYLHLYLSPRPPRACARQRPRYAGGTSAALPLTALAIATSTAASSPDTSTRFAKSVGSVASARFRSPDGPLVPGSKLTSAVRE